MDKQLAGLKSFAMHVEKFLEQSTGRRDSALSGQSGAGDSARERHRVTLEQTPGASSSSARPPPYAPAPPIPSDSAPPSDAQPPSTMHFSTVRSEVRTGVICIDITNPEQRSAGDPREPRSKTCQRHR